MTYTPGPWYASKTEKDEYDFDTATVGPFDLTDRPLQDHVEDTICYVSGVNHDCTANKNLIAAAPDLYSAVADYLAWGAKTGSDRDLFEERFKEAIAKANGVK